MNVLGNCHRCGERLPCLCMPRPSLEEYRHAADEARKRNKGE